MLLTSHRPPTATSRSLTLLLLLLTLFTSYVKCSNYLVGEHHQCTANDDALRKTLPLRQGSPCISCSCLNGVVVCQRRCPKLDGCYNLVAQENDPCSCKTCEGCVTRNNRTLVHGGLARQGCLIEQCESGVVTVTDQQCHVPCAAPLPPPSGECCPACPGCRIEGQYLRSGETITISTDSCVTCRCVSNSLVCTKQACPVLSCPASRVRKMPGHCCPVCLGQRDKYSAMPGGHCALDHYLQYNGSTNSLDACTSCSCINGEISCTRRTCPPLTCPVQYQMPPDSSNCCPSCQLPEVIPECRHQGQVYQHGDSWQVDECVTCTCTHGQKLCHVDPCPDDDGFCPPGHKREQLPGTCCPVCVPQPATCVAYGSPHYRTYDQQHYDFQGDCKYTLTKECSRRSKFRVKMINHSRGPNSVLPFTRSLVVKLQLNGYSIKVTMMVSRKTKVNGRRVRLPFIHSKDGDELTIEREGHGVQLNTTMGLRLLWDGESYVEVELDPRWMNKTCGLCGNFNGSPEDDILMDDSHNREHHHRNEDIKKRYAENARRWARGRCSRRDRFRGRNSSRTQRFASCSRPSSSRVDRCSVFNSSELAVCHNVLPPHPYYEACMEDMCICSEGRQCQCSAIMAYIRECQRRDVTVSSWRNVTRCGGLECPHGAVYMECAPACRPTCRNPFPNPECHMQRCLPGCYCPYSTVLHRGACIPSRHCPKRDDSLSLHPDGDNRSSQSSSSSSISSSSGRVRRRHGTKNMLAARGGS